MAEPVPAGTDVFAVTLSVDHMRIRTRRQFQPAPASRPGALERFPAHLQWRRQRSRSVPKPMTDRLARSGNG